MHHVNRHKVEKFVYINGQYMASEQARISIFDRSVLFGDAVYEVTGVLGGKLLDFDYHMERLESSLAKLSIPQPLDRTELLAAFRKLVRLNAVSEGIVYVQISRGEAERHYEYDKDMVPTVFMFTQTTNLRHNPLGHTGVVLKTVPDIRWSRRDIKTVNLLGQVLAKQAAREQGAYEALMVGPDGCVTECGSTSFFMVHGKTIITRPLSNDILSGVTRRAILSLCKRDRLSVVERLFSCEEVYRADEAFITGASTFVLPVTSVDHHPIGQGVPGPVTLAMRTLYLEQVVETAI